MKTQSKKSWLEKAAFSAVLCAILSVGSMMAYNLFLTKTNLTVTLDIQDSDPFETIPKIVTDSGGQITSIKQNEDLTYEVKIATRKSKRSFFYWLSKNKDIKKANLEQDKQ